MEHTSRVVDYKIDNFVGVFKKAFSEEYCNLVIKKYDRMVENGFAFSRQDVENVTKINKDDLQIFSHELSQDKYIPLQENQFEFNRLFWENYYPVYEQHYGVLKDSTDRHSSYSYKIQKTLIGGGYHLWHYETGAKNCCNRVLTWILYLNDVYEGGETEFLYQHMRVKPEQGTLVIWPAAFTHTHRGNPPISNNKYIVTGWTEL
jgi:hypothetical protein